VANLYPADAALNLPVEKHSHGVRRLAAIEAARGSFQDAHDAGPGTVGPLGRRGDGQATLEGGLCQPLVVGNEPGEHGCELLGGGEVDRVKAA
jgi:hypothetical protein